MTHLRLAFFSAFLSASFLLASNVAQAQTTPPAEDEVPTGLPESDIDEATPPPDSATTPATSVDAEQHVAEGNDGVAYNPTAEPVDVRDIAELEEPRPADSLSHRHQIGLRGGAGIGGLFAFKYADGPPCSADPTISACRRLSVGFFDADLSFAVSDAVELSFLVRFGLGTNVASGATPLLFGFGARAYSNQHGMVKLFVGGRLMMDIESSTVEGWNSVDFGARGEFGFNFDILRYVGFYLQAGAGIQILNGLYFLGDISGGVQLRFP